MAKGVAKFNRPVGGHTFSQIPRAEIPRSKFVRDHGLKTSFDAGYLVPIFVDEALPGDTFNLSVNSFVRMSTPIYPVMDNLYLDYFFFAVPYRLVWNNFQKFMGELEPEVFTEYTLPVLTAFAVVEQSLSDYLGLPLTSPATLSNVCSLWHRAYNLIWNEWFRDENLQNSVVVDKDDGPDAIADYVLLRRGKRHDYFTSALPFAQKGAAVTLPIGSSAPVIPATSTSSPVFAGGANATMTGGYLRVQAGNSNVAWADSGGNPNVPGGAGDDPAVWTTSGLVADLSSATASTINAIREAFQTQRFLERMARGGSRYTETVRVMFGVTSPDARLQRPEYLGGGSTRINIHPVARTSGTGAGATLPPVAQLGAFAQASGERVGFVKSFTEHTLVLGMVSVRADLNYQQGLNKMFSRQYKEDLYWPVFAHLGEQAVLNKEIYCQGSVDPVADEAVWGYQERYAEYRYKPSIITSMMRSTSSLPLHAWHLALYFTGLPELNEVFIPDQPPMDRVLAVTAGQDFFGDFWFNFIAARPMPVYSVPGLIDHF